MVLLWDYDRKKLEKTAAGRRLILERKLNYGPGKEKISLKEVKNNWNKLHLYPNVEKLFSLLIWGKFKFSRDSRKKSFLW